MTNKQIEYQEYLTTDYWKAVAEKVKERAGYRCQVCNSSKRLEAHHRTYEHFKKELDFLGDLVCLCRGCHGLFHASRKYTPKTKQAQPPKEKIPLAIKKERRFFRRAAVKLGIKQEVLASKGRHEVRRLLEQKLIERAERRRARNERRKARKRLLGECWPPSNAIPPSENTPPQN